MYLKLKNKFWVKCELYSLVSHPVFHGRLVEAMGFDMESSEKSVLFHVSGIVEHILARL